MGGFFTLSSRFRALAQNAAMRVPVMAGGAEVCQELGIGSRRMEVSGKLQVLTLRGRPAFSTCHLQLATALLPGPGAAVERVLLAAVDC